MNAVNIQVGARYRITKRMEDGEHSFIAKVHNVEQREGYEYFGYTPKDPREGAFGYARYYGDNATQYGVIKMERIA